jgi:Kef-type K+ transport system membrane component KefB
VCLTAGRISQKAAPAYRRIPGLIPTTIASLVLLFAWLAHAVGAPELLGGFAAGLSLTTLAAPSAPKRFYDRLAADLPAKERA